MVGRNHADVMRDIRNVIEHLGGEESKIALDYFIPSNYVSGNNQSRPCFKLTKKGCELFATRMTGAKERNLITSLEVAEIVGREHKNVMQDIRVIIGNLDELKIQPTQYFAETTYKGGNGQQRPCFLLTKQGCDLF